MILGKVTLKEVHGYNSTILINNYLKHMDDVQIHYFYLTMKIIMMTTLQNHILRMSSKQRSKLLL